MLHYVEFSHRVHKDLDKVPSYIRSKFYVWLKTIDEIGLERTRIISGFHDEPLKGKRLDQRSVRLNRAYRAIYVLKESKIKVIHILEVTKHDY